MKSVGLLAVALAINSSTAFGQAHVMKMTKFSAYPSEGGLVLYGDFTVKNTSPNRAVKDFVFRCTFVGESGTVLQKSVSDPILSVVQPGKSRRFSKVQIGLAPKQKSDYGCDVMSAEWD